MTFLNFHLLSWQHMACSFNILRREQKGSYFECDICKCISLITFVLTLISLTGILFLHLLNNGSGKGLASNMWQAITWLSDQQFSKFIDSYLPQCVKICCHYSDVIMSAMASQITSLMIVYSTIYPCTNQRKRQCSVSLVFVTSEFPVQRASNAENVSIWWCHHANSKGSRLPANPNISALSLCHLNPFGLGIAN